MGRRRLKRTTPRRSCWDWFIQEQVEEEKSALEIVEQLRRIGDTGTGLLFLGLPVSRPLRRVRTASLPRTITRLPAGHPPYP